MLVGVDQKLDALPAVETARQEDVLRSRRWFIVLERWRMVQRAEGYLSPECVCAQEPLISLGAIGEMPPHAVRMKSELIQRVNRPALLVELGGARAVLALEHVVKNADRME